MCVCARVCSEVCIIFSCRAALYCSQRRVKHYASWAVCLAGIMKTIT